MDTTLAEELDPSLKDLQTESMTNEKVFTPEVPPLNCIKPRLAMDATRKKLPWL